MADTITDARTLLFDGGDGTGGAPDDLAGAPTGTLDTSTFLEGANSYTISASNSLVGMLFDAGTAQNWANNHFSLTVNSGVVGLMSAKASGGFRVRFCGATVTDFFEVYVGGNNFWPESIQGGWVNFVVDIEAAAASPNNTGGTPPATSAIRYVGIANLLGSMPKMADNTWLDTIHRLPDGTAGILIQGRNGGTTDWNSADILTELGSGQMAFRQGPGGSFVLSTPIQFGINDSTTHGFTDTNSLWLWDDQEFVAADSYALSALGNSGGSTNVTLGEKTGTGDAATGAQGLTISAASAGARWSMDFNDPNVDGVNFYGCSLQHGGAFLLDDAAVSFISTLYIDCNSALISNSEQLRNKIIAANTADGVAFMTTDDLSDIVFCEFGFSDGHAVELTTPIVTTQTSKGNLFTGYGTGNDAELFNNAGGTVTINATDGSDIADVRNGASALTIINNSVTLSLTGIQTDSEVRIINLDDVENFNKELAGDEQILGSVTKATLADAGTGYVATNVLTISGGAGSTDAEITVDTVGGGGEILTFTVTTTGSYTANPPTPASVTGGAGSGATFRLDISGTFDFAYDADLGVNVAIIVFHLNFKEVRIEQILPAVNSSIPIQQNVDRTYNNP